MYKRQHIYLFYDLEELSPDELAALDVTEQEWADYIARVEAYMQERPSDMRRSVAVSYTHLDVYKRQI